MGQKLKTDLFLEGSSPSGGATYNDITVILL